jgi:hypothetical protein
VPPALGLRLLAMAAAIPTEAITAMSTVAVAGFPLCPAFTQVQMYAGVIIIGSVVLLRVRSAHSYGGNVHAEHQQFAGFGMPSDMVITSFSLLSTAVMPLMQGLRRSSYLSTTDNTECVEDVEVGGRADDVRERKRAGEAPDD